MLVYPDAGEWCLRSKRNDVVVLQRGRRIVGNCAHTRREGGRGHAPLFLGRRPLVRLRLRLLHREGAPPHEDEPQHYLRSGQRRRPPARRGEAEIRRPVKTYGRDHGGHREGRRNFVEHTDYIDPDDGTKRTRVRFNLEGPYGAAFVFAEVSKDLDGFVYLMVQDKRNGAVINVEDQRSALLARRMAGGSEEGQNVFSALLGGGGGGQK